MLTSVQTQLHDTAKRLAKEFHRIEGELLDVLQKIDQEKIYLALGYSSLFQYSISELHLSEAQAYAFMAVARKAKEVPALKTEIKKGDLTISKAARIVSVVTSQNQLEWINKAKTLPKAEVEKAVAKMNPESAKREIVRRFDEKSLRVTLNLSEEGFAKLKRVQVLESTRQRKNVSMEEVISQMSELYLEKKDPVKKAERFFIKNKESCAPSNIVRAETKTENKLCPGKVPEIRSLKSAKGENRKQGSNNKESVQISRKPISASIKYQIMQRDRGVCQFQAATGQVCGNPSFIEIHHKVPVSKNGANTLENLTTLCSKHHRYHHEGEQLSDNHEKCRLLFHRA